RDCVAVVLDLRPRVDVPARLARAAAERAVVDDDRRDAALGEGLGERRLRELLDVAPAAAEDDAGTGRVASARVEEGLELLACAGDADDLGCYGDAATPRSTGDRPPCGQPCGWRKLTDVDRELRGELADLGRGRDHLRGVVLLELFARRG